MKNISADALREWIARERPPLLVDVREAHEREAFHIGGLHLPMSELGERWEELKQELPVVVYCAKGVRSVILIQRFEGLEGMPELWNLEGGLAKWKFGDR